MSSKDQAVQNAANAVAVLTQAVNDYGNSPEARGAASSALNAVAEARNAGATDDDLSNAHPQ